MNNRLHHHGFALLLVLALPFPGLLAPAAARAETTDTQAGAPRQTERLRFAFAEESFINVNINDATAAYRVFLRRLAQDSGRDIDVETEIYPDNDQLVQALIRDENPPQLSVILAWKFVQLDLPPTIHPALLVAEQESPGRAYVILTRQDGPLDSIEKLQDRTFNLWGPFGATITRSLLETLLSEAGLPAPETFFREITVSAKPNAILLPVFFGTKDACLIDEPSYDLMCELNPQLRRTLRVILRTELLADVVICSRDDAWKDKAFRDDYLDSLTHLERSVDGRQILTLFKIQGLVPFREEHLASTRDLYRRWQTAVASNQR